MPDDIEFFRYRIGTPIGTFQRVSQRDLRFAVVYLPEERRAAGDEGFCHGWATTEEGALQLAEEVRAKLRAEPLIVPITERRPWVRHADLDLEE